MPTSCAAPANDRGGLPPRSRVVLRVGLSLLVLVGSCLPFAPARAQQVHSNAPSNSHRSLPPASTPSGVTPTDYRRSATPGSPILRQKVSIPLELLVEPVALNDWLAIKTAHPAAAAPASNITPVTSPASTEPGPLDNPFVDDPEPYQPAGEELPPIQPAAFSDDQPEGKIPSSKLIGIMGRVLQRTSPVPSLSDVREKLPDWASIPAGEIPAGAGAAATPAAEAASPDEEDPFGGF